MDDFASAIAAGKKLPSLTLSLKVFDPPVFIHDAPVPECKKIVMGCGLYSVTSVIDFFGHDQAPIISVSATVPTGGLNIQRCLGLGQLTFPYDALMRFVDALDPVPVLAGITFRQSLGDFINSARGAAEHRAL